MLKGLFSFIVVFLCLPLLAHSNFSPLTYSPDGTELIVSFEGVFRSEIREIPQNWNENQKSNLTKSIAPTIKFLFGPLTHRSLGGIKENLKIEVQWDKAFIKNRKVHFPYHYEGLWLIHDQQLSLPGQFMELPLPFNTRDVYSEGWLKCTDSDPEHQTESFYWYFWDPSRYGCDHNEGKQYQKVKVDFQLKTTETQLTFPEYDRMNRIQTDGTVARSFTFAFGYADDKESSNPDQDTDQGAQQFRLFKKQLKSLITSLGISGVKLEPITRNDYFDDDDMTKIGEKYTYEFGGIKWIIKVVINSQIDQMNLFAKSFAHDHDGYFAWMGHSRVGSGFDAWQFQNILDSNPEYYSITDDYQLVYWGGCNSYSYYTVPFFNLKSRGNPEDTKGTKNLDIIANTLPSLFAFNASNALIQAKALLSSPMTPVSYQQILNETEKVAQGWGYRVLVVILGDEDNL